MKPIVWILGASLAAVLTLGVPSHASAQDAVINSVSIDTNGDMPGFLELFKRSQAIAKRLGNPAPRLLQGMLAGEQTNNVVINTEHKSLAALAQSLGKTQADAEWQKLIADAGSKGISATSNSVWAEISPEGAGTARGSVVQFVGVDTNGETQALLDIVKRARAINARLSTGGTARVWQATLAGDQTNSIGIGIEFQNLEAFAQATTKQQGDADWQKLVAEVQTKGIATTSNSLWTEITP
jgi:hypothetical protein